LNKIEILIIELNEIEVTRVNRILESRICNVSQTINYIKHQMALKNLTYSVLLMMTVLYLCVKITFFLLCMCCARVCVCISKKKKKKFIF